MDKTIPLKGGWILCTKVPPTEIKAVALGLYFAKPEKVFECGSFDRAFWNSAFSDKELEVLYRHRQRAKLSAEQREILSGAERRASGGFIEWEGSPISPFDDSTEEELADAAAIEPQPLPTLDEVELEMRVRIVTQDGEVCLEPHEYTIVADIEPYMQEIGEAYEMRELGGIKQAKKLREQVFYLASRGIRKIEAYKMLLGQIERPNVFWLEPHPELQRYFGYAA